RPSLIARGVETIGGLADLSDDAVAASVELALWRRLASGDDDRPVIGSACPRAVSVHAALDGALVGVDGLAGHVCELAGNLASQLTAGGWLARQLTVRVVDITHAAHSGTISLATAVSSGTLLAGAAVTALRQALSWSRSVTRLSVRASSLCLSDLQPSLFARADRRSRSQSCGRTARGFRDLERILSAAGDRTLTRRAS
ncbi:MAG: hypothetical protein ACRD2X_10705, partial [Vicinamibacteraceae bacterium]